MRDQVFLPSERLKPFIQCYWTCRHPEDVLEVMKQHQIRRVPVIDDHELVGIISQADVALSLAQEEAGETVAEISA